MASWGPQTGLEARRLQSECGSIIEQATANRGGGGVSITPFVRSESAHITFLETQSVEMETARWYNNIPIASCEAR